MNWLWLALSCGASSKEQPAAATDLIGLSLFQVEPSVASTEGSERVVLYGAGFDESSVVRVNGVDCLASHYASGQELACLTPPSDAGVGTISVFRSVDEAVAELSFEIVDDAGATESDDSGVTVSDTGDGGGPPGDSGEGPMDVLVEYCHVQWPCTLSLVAGQPSEPIYSWVNTVGVTDAVGAGDGLVVSLGFGEATDDPQTEWSWSECSFNADKDGLSAGDLANDEFVGVVQAPEIPGNYRYAARARIGEGPWLLCDLGGDACAGDGSQDGFSVVSTGEMLVTDP